MKWNILNVIEPACLEYIRDLRTNKLEEEWLYSHHQFIFQSETNINYWKDAVSRCPRFKNINWERFIKIMKKELNNI